MKDKYTIKWTTSAKNNCFNNEAFKRWEESLRMPNSFSSSYDAMLAVISAPTDQKLTIMPTETFEVSRIIRNGPATIVFWKDGTKTVVKKAELSYDDPYAAFCAALAKKLYGTNSRIKKILEKKTEPFVVEGDKN